MVRHNILLALAIAYFLATYSYVFYEISEDVDAQAECIDKGGNIIRVPGSCHHIVECASLRHDGREVLDCGVVEHCSTVCELNNEQSISVSK